MEAIHSKSFHVYPIYFDADKSVSEGRRIPKSLAKKNPNANDILLVITQKLGLASEIEKDKSHPKSLVGTGRVKVFNVNESKNQLLLKIAAFLPDTSSNSITSNNSNTAATSPTLNSSNSVQLAPNLVYQVRSKKKKNQK